MSISASTPSAAATSILENGRRSAALYQQIIHNATNMAEIQVDLDQLVIRLTHERIRTSAALPSLISSILEDKSQSRSNEPVINFAELASGLYSIASKYGIQVAPPISGSNLLDLTEFDKFMLIYS